MKIVEIVAPAMYDTDNSLLRTEQMKLQEANCTMTHLTIISFDPYRFLYDLHRGLRKFRVVHEPLKLRISLGVRFLGFKRLDCSVTYFSNHLKK